MQTFMAEAIVQAIKTLNKPNSTPLVSKQIQIKSLDEQNFMKTLGKVSDDIYIDNKKKPE